MLSKEQIDSVKKQLLSQLENLPESQRDSIKSQIDTMPDEELEEFLIKNNLIKINEGGNKSNGTKSQSANCTFCLLIKGSIPSHKIAETKEAIAILEINPISRGHILIIPREHLSSKELSKISKELETLSKSLSEYIKTKLEVKNVEIIPSELFGHVIINLIPLSSDKTLDLDAKRYKASDEELEELEKLLKYSAKESEGKIEKSKSKKISSKDKKPKREKSSSKKEISISVKKLEKEDLSKLPKAPRRRP